MSNGEKRPGEAAADRARERIESGRSRRHDAIREVFHDGDENTQPRMLIHRFDTRSRVASDERDSLQRKLRPYVVGGVLALAALGIAAGSKLDLGQLLRVVLNPWVLAE